MSDRDDRQPLAGPSFAAGEGYAARYLAAKHRIGLGQARDLIAEVGPDRERLNLVASKVRHIIEG